MTNHSERNSRVRSWNVPWNAPESGPGLALGLGVLLLSAGMLFPACGGGEAAPITEASFCAEKAKRECKKMMPLCSYMQTECETARNTACMQLAQSQRTGTRVFKPQNTGACLSKIDQTLSRSSNTAAQWEEMIDVCNRVWEGDGAMQSPCANRYECKRGLICDRKNAQACAQETRVAANAFCNNYGEVCPAGQQCLYDDAIMAWACKPQASGGAMCGPQPAPSRNTIQCTSELRCVNGLCGSKLANLSPCDTNSDCTSGLCEPFQRVCATVIAFSLGSPSCAGFLSPQPMTQSSSDAAAMGTPDGGAGDAADPGDAAAGDAADPG